jgi:hypothetical protein
MFGEPPTTKVTGTLTNCGLVFCDWKTRVAVYTPFAKPAADAVTFTVVGPVAPSGDITSQLVV